MVLSECLKTGRICTLWKDLAKFGLSLLFFPRTCQRQNQVPKKFGQGKVCWCLFFVFMFFFPRPSIDSSLWTLPRPSCHLPKKPPAGSVPCHWLFSTQSRLQYLFFAGPYKINGVPLRRVNRRYCICTSTHIDLKGINVNVPDDLFARKKGLRKGKDKKSKDETSGTTWLKRPRTHGKNKSEAAYFEEFEAVATFFIFHCLSFLSSQQKKQSNLARKECQKQIDEPLIKRLKELDPLLPKYLSSIFTLQKGDRPHEMKF